MEYSSVLAKWNWGIRMEREQRMSYLSFDGYKISKTDKDIVQGSTNSTGLIFPRGCLQTWPCCILGIQLLKCSL